MKILIKLPLSSLILGFFSGVVSGLGLLCVCVVVCSVSLCSGATKGGWRVLKHPPA